ncbi:MAG: PIN domain-containing protein [Betaproteobacteria bacterium]|nr:PIN domain-containing protein [Betaproteobacteria bacterium]HLF39753.1 PIN domain-containing protein [Burkholderiales bacterium]
MQRLFVDTSAWFAFTNRADPDHKAVAALLDAFKGRLVTSNFVFDETVTLCLYRLGHAAAERVGQVLRDSNQVDLVRVAPEDETAAWQLFRERADKQYSFTDCASFALMRRLDLKTAAALDDDFAGEGFEQLPPLAR